MYSLIFNFINEMDSIGKQFSCICQVKTFLKNRFPDEIRILFFTDKYDYYSPGLYGIMAVAISLYIFLDYVGKGTHTFDVHTLGRMVI